MISDHFFCLPNEKKPPENNHYKILPSEEMGNKHGATRHKNKPLSDYDYSIALLLLYNAKLCLISIKTGQFIKLYKIM